MVSKSTTSLDPIYCQSVVEATLAPKKQRRVVLVVQPFADFCGSGSRCHTITINYLMRS